MAVKLWGPMLTGIAQGFQDYQQGQEDLAYTRQTRANQLASQQLANQSGQMQNQAQQQQLQNASLTHNYWVDALNSPDSQAQQTTQQAAPAGSAQVANAAQGPQQAQGGFTPKGPMSMTQLSDLDKKYGLPAGTAYGLMNAESGGNPDAVSSKGAQGLFQVLPSTGAQPGYGLKSFNPKDPDGAMGYFAALYKKAGGDINRAAQMWNAGPGGNADNPETKAFVPRVLRGQQQFANASALDNAKQQPTPADNIAARESAGVSTPVTAYNQANQAQQRQIQTMLQAAKNAEKDGHPELAQNFYAQASKLQDQQVSLQEKTNKIQKDANEETQKLAGGVSDQSSYNNFVEQLRQNPAMQAAVAGLNLTGEYDLDRNKMQTLADRATSLKDQQELKIKQDDLALKQQKEQRDQRKEEAPRIAQQQAQQADQQRQQANQAKGVPFSPSIAAVAPAGTTPQQMQAASQKIQKDNATALQKSATADNGNKQITQLTTQLLGLLDKPNPVTTGGMTRIPGVGAVTTAFENDRQLFDKVSNQLITSMQNSQAGAGGGRSSFTAAMFDRIKVQKPNLDLAPAVNRQIALELYAGASVEQNRAAFTREYLSANPDAPIQNAQLAWANYEQNLGPSFIVDPTAPDGFRPNFAGVPKLPDGRANPNYKDYHDFFKGQQ